MSSVTRKDQGESVVVNANAGSAGVAGLQDVDLPEERRPAPNLKKGLIPSRVAYRLVGVVSVIALLVIWQVMSDTNVVNPALSSSPSGVWDTARQMISDGTLGAAVWSTAGLFAVGLGVSIFIGVTAGIILGWWRLLGAVFDPLVAMLYATPLIALLPLVLVWFGISFKGQVVMVVLVSVFPLLVNVMVGTRQVDPGLLRLATSFRGSQLAVLRTLVIPSIVPYIVTGVRLAVGGALIGVTLAEYFEGNSGIGGVILRAGTELNAGMVFVGIVVLAGTSLTLTALIRAVEGRVSGWRDER